VFRYCFSQLYEIFIACQLSRKFTVCQWLNHDHIDLTFEAMAEISSDIAKAAEILRKNELAAIPTETVYGLGGNALNRDAVVRIFEAKERPFFDPLIVHVASKEAAIELAKEVPEAAEKLMDAFWPGPLTLVLPKRDMIPDLVTSGLPTVGLRVPNQSLTLELLRTLDFPLAAPSANPFGYVSPTSAQHVHDQLGEKIPFILDGGETTVGVESTIVGFENDQPVVYRLGGLSVEEIEVIVGRVEVKVNASSDPKAPGMLKSHYAPKHKLYLGDLKSLYAQFEGKRIGFLSFAGSGLDATKKASFL
jgi:L-threonylcarbamoyladenylate synthase